MPPVCLPQAVLFSIGRMSVCMYVMGVYMSLGHQSAPEAGSVTHV